jgi:hypothetical protein
VHATASRLLLSLLVLAISPIAASEDLRCSEHPRLRVLDFWVGEWTVHVGAQQVGTNTIEKELGGCALSERWRGADGTEGRSWFYFDRAMDRWKQVWVTQDGLRTGGTKEKTELAPAGTEAQVRFQGAYATDDGSLVADRTTLTALADGSVRQLIEISADGGETWRTVFDARYVRSIAAAR